jgi:hypothetical protein
MKSSLGIVFLLFVLLLSHDGRAQPPDRDTVLTNLIESYGGERNLRKLDSMVQEWDMVALMGNRHGKDLRSIRLPGQLRVELSYPDKRETRILNGDASHVMFNDGPAQVAQAPQRSAMRLQLMRLYSPLALWERREALNLTVEGDLCALSLTEDGLRADYLIDTENWRIDKVVGTLNINGGEMRFLTEYSDFAFVEGVLVHQKENKYAGGVNTAVLQLRQIELRADLPDDRFLP